MTAPIAVVTYQQTLSEKQRDAIQEMLGPMSKETGIKFIVMDGGTTVQFDHTAELLKEQRRTNDLLVALIQAIAEESGETEPVVDMDGNPRANPDQESQHLG